MIVDIFNTTNRYQVIYADPPWQYKHCGRGSAKKHYDTMSFQSLEALPIKNIKTEDSVLFMWATFPKIEDALALMKSWGFYYKTAAFIWVKTNKRNGEFFCGTGQYTRANAEVCLLGTANKCGASSMVVSHRVRQIIKAPLGSHSTKPDEIRNSIITLFGDKPRIELFARQTADGWDSWGNELPTQRYIEETDEGGNTE